MITHKSASGSTPSPTSSGIAEPRGNFVSDSASALLRYASPLMTAVMVDAGFYLKRAKALFGDLSPHQAAETLHKLALLHLDDNHRKQRIARLYRIFVYDAPPPEWKGHTAIKNLPIDFSKSKNAVWRREFHDALRGKRKVALRMGEVPTNYANWKLKPEILKALRRGKRKWEELEDDDFRLDVRQKGVDMRLGLDIASLAFKRLVGQIVLISGDADFVPAAKLARREGIDFVLDPMWASIRPDLYEHIDALHTVCPKKGNRIGKVSQEDEEDALEGN